MKNWTNYPETYRNQEITHIHQAVDAGESVSVVGLSGSGKSNLLGFLVYSPPPQHRYLFIDGNHLLYPRTEDLLEAIKSSLVKEFQLSEVNDSTNIFEVLDLSFNKTSEKICLVIDRFDFLSEDEIQRCGANLRALRDRHKYELCYVFGTRSPIPIENEISELVFGNTIWLGVLTQEDAYWSIQQYANRKKLVWDMETQQKIYQISCGYPSFLRAVSEAFAAGCELAQEELIKSPIIQRRVTEFLSAHPSPEVLQNSGLSTHPWCSANKKDDDFSLTDKERRLLDCLLNNPENIIEKEHIIQSVWPEDKIYQDGIRDDSLAQLVRRLRKKLEDKPGNRYQIVTIVGRGYKIKETPHPQ